MIPYLQYFIIIILVFFLGWSLSRTTCKVESFEDIKKQDISNDDNPHKIHTWIINLDKNKDRLNQSMGYYNTSDFSILPIKRYSAIVGANLEPEDWLSEYALKEFYETKRRGYRTRHYQLTKGGIGCFLSHMNLFKNLVKDPKNEIYLVLEDDIKINKSAYMKIQKILENPPKDWDIILLGFNKIFNYQSETKDYSKVKSFWGTCGYLINKKGAQQFLDAHKTIDAQIDSFMSWMAIKNKLNIYALNNPIIFPDSFYTDIQINIFPLNKVDAFRYRDIYLGE